MGNIPVQYIYDKNLWMVGETPTVIKPTGKFPVIANQQWNSIADAEKFINDPESTAIPGMVITVVNKDNPEENGIYFVERIHEYNDETGEERTGTISKVSDSVAVTKEIEKLNDTINQHVTDSNVNFERIHNDIQEINQTITDNIIGEGEGSLKYEVNKLGERHDAEIKELTDKHNEDITNISTKLDTDITNLERKHDDDIVNTRNYGMNSGAEDNWRTEEVGGVAAGKSRTDFEDKSVYDVLDMILYPTLQPKITQPSVTLKYKGNGTDKQIILVEVGTKTPTRDDFEMYYNRGSVEYDNAEGNRYYAGEPDKKDDLNIPVTESGNLPEGRTTVKYTVVFPEGPELNDNKGGIATVPNYGGGTKFSEKYFDAVYPIYSNINDIMNVEKLPLYDYVKGNIEFIVNIPDEVMGEDHKFELHVPAHLTVTSIMQYNDVSQKYDVDTNYMLGNVTTELKDFVSYNIYKRTTDLIEKIGSTKYQIRINKL